MCHSFWHFIQMKRDISAFCRLLREAPVQKFWIYSVNLSPAWNVVNVNPLKIVIPGEGFSHNSFPWFFSLSLFSNDYPKRHSRHVLCSASPTIWFERVSFSQFHPSQNMSSMKICQGKFGIIDWIDNVTWPP